MDNDIGNDFTVKFGEHARTVHYADSIGDLDFCFDFGSDGLGGDILLLEVWNAAQRRKKHGARFDVAIQRVAKFLESHYGVVRVMETNPMTTEDEQRSLDACEQSIAAAVAEGSFTNRRTWTSRCRAWLKRLF